MDKLIKKIDEKKLLRTMGFPMMMPIVKGFEGSWEAARVTIDQIVVLHVNDKYERILKALDGYFKKGDIIEAFEILIKRDFFEKGFSRELIAKNIIKNMPNVKMIRNANPEEDKMGIDLVWIDGDGCIYAASVKGYEYYYLPEYRPHLRKLKGILDNYCGIYIYFIDERNEDYEVKEVINEKKENNICL